MAWSRNPWRAGRDRPGVPIARVSANAVLPSKGAEAIFRPFSACSRMVVTFLLVRTPMCSLQESGAESRLPSLKCFPVLLRTTPLTSTPHAFVRGLTNERHIPIKNSVQSLALAAALSGLMGGTTVRLNAQTAQSNGTTVQAAPAGILL